MKLWHEERLAGVHPDLVKVVNEAVFRVPFDIVVLEGRRTLERQKYLVATGASKTMLSRHLTGHAVDIAPMLPAEEGEKPQPSWHWEHYNKLAPIIKEAAEAVKVPVEWGGDWQTFKDGPHWQLPKETYH